MSIAPISPVGQPEAAPAPARVPLAREALWALVVAVVVAGLGAPFGLLWSKLAPHVELVQTQYGPYPIEGEPEGYWADDGWFILMSIGMGIVIAVVAWLLLRRFRGPILLAALVVGSAGASVLGAWLGNKIGWAHYLDLATHAPENTHIFRPVKLRTGTSSLLFGFIPWVRGTMLVQALAAAAVYTGLAGFHASPTLRYDNMPVEYLDQPAPPPGYYPGADAGQSSEPDPGAYPAPGFHPAPGAHPDSGADEAAGRPAPGDGSASEGQPAPEDASGHSPTAGDGHSSTAGQSGPEGIDPARSESDDPPAPGGSQPGQPRP
ncbi:hypothetical protein [Dactylosporangium salmoneum]|uniref:DUF2567 domain-containing protein n=1 Tax=Dactylosporangium salmoneum TaxID=53361 RepID=A0ABP5SZM5_9ACTN